MNNISTDKVGKMGSYSHWVRRLIPNFESKNWGLNWVDEPFTSLCLTTLLYNMIKPFSAIYQQSPSLKLVILLVFSARQRYVLYTCESHSFHQKYVSGKPHHCPLAVWAYHNQTLISCSTSYSMIVILYRWAINWSKPCLYLPLSNRKSFAMTRKPYSLLFQHVAHIF